VSERRPWDLGDRTFQFSVRIVKFVARLPKSRIAEVLGGQLLRAGTSVGANWQEAVGASSPSDFAYRVEVCEREARESNYWLRLLQATGSHGDTEAAALEAESKELVAIFTAIGRKQRRNR
jgi:four helix bundle protein